MKGDFSRLRFRPRDRYSGVRMQQGRVHLDAEWNEQVDIEAHRDEMTALDVIGPHGVPHVGGGFAIAAGAGLNGISFPAGGAGWAVGEEATLIESGDQGVSFGAPVAPPAGVTEGLNAVHLVAAGDGWAVGEAGTVLRLAGGAWSQVPVGAVTGALLGLHFTAADQGWIVGERATLVRRSGTNWTPQTAQEFTGSLRDVAALSATRAFAVGDRGAIVTTSDGGTTWPLQPVDAQIGTLYAVTAMIANGAERAWAVGAGGVIVALDDDGEWKRVSTPRDFTATLRGVAFLDAANGFAVGDDGTVLKTNNGGANWNRQSMPAGFASDLRALALAGNVPVAVGDHAVVRPGQTPALGTLAGAARSLTISPGDAYVHGVRCVNERAVTYSTQPDYPGARLPAPPDGGEATYGAYLRRAEHHVTAVEREELRERALGGPDTTTRTQTVWQVRLTELTEGTCAALEAAIAPAPAAERALLRARSTPSAQAASECIVAPGGGYKRLENQLYRVEVVGQEQAENGATVTAFTWSRENGSVAAKVLAIDADDNAVTFAELDRDEALSIGPDHWIEVTDEGRALRGERGLVAKVKTVRGPVIEVTGWPGGATPSMGDFPHTPIVRRWEGKAPLETGKWIELEGGVEVEFATGEVEPGDFWTIPARTLLGNVEWPLNGSTPVFEQRAERGVRNAPLAIVKRHSGGTWERLHDCRRRFPSLTGLVNFYYVGGDGQEGEPDLTVPSPRPLVPLDQDLRVGVSNWRWPVEGARVRFRRAAGNGAITGRGPGVQVVMAGENVVVRTNSEGVAACGWSIDADTDGQVVEATLLDEQDGVMQTPIRFSANRSVASRVAYQPGAACTALAGVTDVQGALERVTGAIRLHHVAGDGVHGLPGSQVELQAGLSSGCSGQAAGRVRFEVRPMVDGSIATAQPVTAQNGVAACTYTLGDNPRQEIVATLVDAQNTPVATTPPIVFTLSVTRAGEVTFDPSKCSGMTGADTVQEAIDVLCQRDGACTVDIGPGDDLKEAFERLKERGGGELCLAAGLWEVDSPVEVVDLSDVVVSGRGPATVIRSKGTADALVFRGCRKVTVRDVRIEGFAEQKPSGVRGALTFLGTSDVRVADCELRCGDRPDAIQACLVVAGEGEGQEGPAVNRVEIERNRLEVGSWQTGVLVLDGERTTIARNHVRLVPQGAFNEDPRPVPPDRITGGLTREIGAALVAGRTGVVSGQPVEAIEVHGERMVFPAGSPHAFLVRDFARRFPEPSPEEPLEERLRRFVAAVAGGEVSDEARDRLREALAELASVGRGLWVAGRLAPTVQIFDNVVEDAIQGIGVAVSHARTEELEAAGDVVISRNVVRCAVPFTWQGQRSGILVGSAESVMIKDTVASLVRTGQMSEPRPPHVDAIRVSGRLGPFLSVSQSSLRGFDLGVRVEPDFEQAPEIRMWLVSETVLADGGPAVQVPSDWVQVERCVP